MKVINRLAALSTPTPLNMADMLKRQTEPRADCSRYDHRRRGSHAIR